MHIEHLQVQGGGIYDRNVQKKKKTRYALFGEIFCMCNLNVTHERKQYEDKQKMFEHLLAVFLSGVAPGISNRAFSPWAGLSPTL